MTFLWETQSFCPQFAQGRNTTKCPLLHRTPLERRCALASRSWTCPVDSTVLPSETQHLPPGHCTAALGPGLPLARRPLHRATPTAALRLGPRLAHAGLLPSPSPRVVPGAQQPRSLRASPLCQAPPALASGRVCTTAAHLPHGQVTWCGQWSRVTPAAVPSTASAATATFKS